MTLTPYQIVVPAIAFLAMLYAWSLMLRQKKSIWETILWTIFWGFIAAIAIFPALIDYLTAATGIQKRENAVMVTFLGILFFLVFSLIMRLEELEQRHARLVRKVALKDAQLKGDIEEIEN